MVSSALPQRERKGTRDEISTTALLAGSGKDPMWSRLRVVKRTASRRTAWPEHLRTRVPCGRVQVVFSSLRDSTKYKNIQKGLMWMLSLHEFVSRYAPEALVDR